MKFSPKYIKYHATSNQQQAYAHYKILGYAKLRYIDGHIRRSSSVVSDVRALVHHTDDSEDENTHVGLLYPRVKGSA